MLRRVAPGCSVKVAFARAGYSALLWGLLLVATTIQIGVETSDATLVDSQGAVDARAFAKDACASALGGALLQKGCQAYQSSGDRLALWSSLIQVTRICKLDEPGPAPEDPEAALAASGNATDSYGLFWQVETAAPFQAFVAGLNNATGLHNRYRARTMAEYIAAWVEVWPNASFVGPNDWWMIGGDVYGEDVNHGVFLETGRLLQQDPDYQVSDIPVAFRNAGTSAYAGRFSALPLWLTTYQLLYRRDIFEARNITPPRTWDEAIAIAEQYGRGKLGPGQPDLGFCFESKPACGYAHAAVIYILASMVQLTGPSHGAWFDPDTLEPLYQGVAFREALRIYRTLRRHSVPDETPCWEVYRSIASGRCLMMWGFAYGFKAASHNSSAMSGRQGVAASPGSPVALDRRTGLLQPCTKELCPFATPHVEPSTGRSVLVNVVTPIDTLNLAINALSPVNRQAAAYIMLRNFTRPEQHTRVMLMPKTEVVPMRYSQLDEKLWVDAGYNPTDVGDFLQTYRNSFASQNVYYELRIPGVFPIYWLLHNTMIKALYTNATDDELIAFAVGGTEPIFDANGGRTRLIRLYQMSLGYVPPKQASAAEQHRATATVLVAVLVPVLSCLVLLAAGLWGYLHWRRLAHEKRDRLLAAPGPGPATTLLVTDIQDSTCLWESLPAEVMDAAVKLHHRVIRELLLPHHGYETATEGDSFLLAFHKPDSALAFALAAQSALLSADWPSELLSSPYAAILCVRHDAAAWGSIAPCISAPLLQEALAFAAVEAGDVSDQKRLSQPRAFLDVARQPGTESQQRRRRGIPRRMSLGALTSAQRPATTPSLLQPPGSANAFGQPPRLQSPPAAAGPALAAVDARMQPATDAADPELGLATAVQAVVDEAYTHSVSSNNQEQPRSGPGGAAVSPWAAPEYSVAVVANIAAPSVRSNATLGAAASALRSRPYAATLPPRAPARLQLQPQPGKGASPQSLLPSSAAVAYSATDCDKHGVDEATTASGRATDVHAGAFQAAHLTPVFSVAQSLDGRTGEAALDTAGTAASEDAATASTSELMTGHSFISAAAHRQRRQSRLTTASLSGISFKDALRLGFPASASFSDMGMGHVLGGADLSASTAAASRQPPCAHADSGLLIFRGLRVRMGLHCGLSGPAEVQYNRASGRITYPGKTMAMAKAVSDVGRGGNILLSSRVARALDQKATHSGAYVLLGAGRHVLKDGEEPVQLVAAFSRSLLPRAGHLLAPRSVEEKIPGVLSAPLGRAAVSVAQVQDAEEFAGWGLESSLESHRALLRDVGACAAQRGGYLVATAPGSFQAVFTSPAAAMTWLLAVQTHMAPTLQSCGNEVKDGATTATGSVADMAPRSRGTSISGSVDTGDAVRQLKRATAFARLSILHLRGGVDVGPVQACLAEAGEASYSGGAVKRAACLAAHAAWHEVLVSLEAAREVTGIKGGSGASFAPAVAGSPSWLPSKKRMMGHVRGAADGSSLVQPAQPSSPQLSTLQLRSGMSGTATATQQLPSALVSSHAAAVENEAARGWDGAAPLTPSASGDVDTSFQHAAVCSKEAAEIGAVTRDRVMLRMAARAPSHLGIRARDGDVAVVAPAGRRPPSATGLLLGLPSLGPAPVPVNAFAVQCQRQEEQEELQQQVDIVRGQERPADEDGDGAEEPTADIPEPCVQQEGGGAAIDAAHANRGGSFAPVPPVEPAPASLPTRRVRIEALPEPVTSMVGAAGAPSQLPQVPRGPLRNRAVNFLRRQAARVSGAGSVAAQLASPGDVASDGGADKTTTYSQLRPSSLGMAVSASGAQDAAGSPAAGLAHRTPNPSFAAGAVEVVVHTITSGPVAVKSGTAEGDAAGAITAQPAAELLVFSREVLAVKHRGSVLEACAVRLGGVHAAGAGAGVRGGPKPTSAAAAALPSPV